MLLYVNTRVWVVYFDNKVYTHKKIGNPKVLHDYVSVGIQVLKNIS